MVIDDCVLLLDAVNNEYPAIVVVAVAVAAAAVAVNSFHSWLDFRLLLWSLMMWMLVVVRSILNDPLDLGIMYHRVQ